MNFHWFTERVHSRVWIVSGVWWTVWLAAAGSVYAGEPIRLHPGNPHYFEFRGQPTVLITSGEHYGAVLNLDFDYLPYLDELRSHGLNLTRTFSGAYCENPTAFNIEKNTLAPYPWRLICPWKRSRVPGYFNGGNKFDLNTWDEEYFQRLRDFVAQAGKRGIVVELVLFCPFYGDEMWKLSPMNAINNINGYSMVSRTEVYALKDERLTEAQTGMVRRIVRELQNADNLFYEVCNEPYFGGVTREWQNHIIDTIVAEESSFPHRHLIAQNIANGSGVIEKPNPQVSIFNFHYAYPPDAVAQNFHLNKVIGYDETGFSGNSDTKYRGDGWAFLMAGGGLYDNLDYSFTPDYETGIASPNAPGGGSRALRCQLKVLKDFMESFDFIRMKPDPSVITSLEGDSKVRGWCLAEEGKAYAFYFRFGDRVKIKLNIPPGSYRAEWIHTLTGNVEQAGTVKHPGGEMALESPGYVDDIALRIKIQTGDDVEVK
ncbi:MAG TPA: cellulase family glycosylhydrolase [bacterium]|nr:cellulase family glycosylhydrolase [bacterium]